MIAVIVLLTSLVTPMVLMTLITTTTTFKYSDIEMSDDDYHTLSMLEEQERHPLKEEINGTSSCRVTTGRTSIVPNINTSSDTKNVFLENIIIPLYTLLVILYLIETYFWRRRKEQLKKKLRQKYHHQQQQRQLQQEEQQQELKEQKENKDSEIVVEKKVAVPKEVDKKVGGGSGQQKQTEVCNLSGRYKCISIDDNYEKFLAVQGVPWTYRKMAKKARPIHKITHIINEDDADDANRKDKLTINIEVAGLYDSETSYIINGPPAECDMRGRIFLDVVSYLPTGDGIQVYKRAQADSNPDNAAACKESYDLIVCRRLSKDKKTIKMTCNVIFHDNKNGKKTTKPNNIESVQMFERIE